jgi:hypothetical protein
MLDLPLTVLWVLHVICEHFQALGNSDLTGD